MKKNSRKAGWKTTLRWSAGLGLITIIIGCAPSTHKAKSQAAVPEPAMPSETAQATPAPKAPTATMKINGYITSDKDVYDFGTVDPGARLEGQFVLKNEGLKPLEIDGDPKSSCGCTVPKLEKTAIEPNQTTDLKFVYYVATNPGKSVKRITVLTKPPAQPRELVLSIAADVRKVIDIKPESLKFEMHPGRPTDYPITVEATDNTPFKILQHNTTSQGVSVDYDKELNATVHQLTVKIDPAMKTSLANGSITFELDHPKLKRVGISFSVVEPFTATPRAKYLQDLVSGRQSKITIVISSNFNEPFELGDVTCEKGLLKVLGIQKAPDGYQIEVGVTPNSTDADLKDQLIVPIKDHPESTIKVLCYGRIKK
jgi:hypothetical protein